MKNFCLVALMLVAMVAPPLAQAQDPSDCISALTPCTPYLNSETVQPTGECCNPLKGAIKNAFTCVCSIIGDLHFVQAMTFNINATASLPKRCGIKVDLFAACQATLTPVQSPASSPDQSMGPTAISMGPSADSMGPSSGPAAAQGPTGAASNTAMSGMALFGSFVILATLMS